MRARAVHPKGGKPKPPALPTTAFRSFIAFLYSAITGVAGSVAWDNVTDKPSTFEPSAHTHTASQVGLGNVQNYGIATKAQAEEGTANNVYMTPLRVANALDLIKDALFPSGGIIMWSGAVNDIPVGWALRDGSNGTPDLRDRFIVGAGGSYNVGDTGGMKEVTLTTSQLPAHKHAISSSSSGGHSHTGITSLDQIEDQNVIGRIHAVTGKHYNAYNETVEAELEGYSWAGIISINPDPINTNHSHTFTTSYDGSHSHDITISSTGDGQAHENRPPYYALAYIMKL
jgi:microcystin-dependent protein